MSAQSINEWLKHLESYKDEDGTQHYFSPQPENVTTQQQFEWLMERGKTDPQMKTSAIDAVAGGFVTENPARIASVLIDAWLSEERSMPGLSDERRSSVLSELAEQYGAAIALVCNKNQAKFIVNAYKAGKLSATSARSRQILDALQERGFIKLTASESNMYCGYALGLDVEFNA